MDVRSITPVEFNQLAALVKKNYGINLTTEKMSLVVGRLHNVLVQKNMDSFSEYYNYITSDRSGEALAILVEKLTTNHTYFMREFEHFDYFRKQVLPYLESVEKTKDLRIWSAGCSTGEEAYTLAMIMLEYFGTNKPLWDTKVLATDISQRVLEFASSGTYLTEQLSPLPSMWRNKYFSAVDNERSMVVSKLRSEVIFRSFNLMKGIFPFKRKFHTIFCRNVMIYFDSETKRKLVDRFYENTEPGGYLFIGHSESLNREETKYKYVMPSVYKKE